jgi:hypothetical protein
MNPRDTPEPAEGAARSRPTGARRRALAWGLVAAVALPWLIGQGIKTTLQPGIADPPARAAQMVDFIVAGAIVFDVSMWLVVAIGCWIVGVMQGPRREADAFPPDSPRQPR